MVVLDMINRKVLITTVASVLTIGAVSGAVALNSRPQPTGADTSPITTTLQKQQDELDNHDARIGNNENDIHDLQTATGTAPNPNNVEVPVINKSTSTTPTDTPSVTPVVPAPIVVTSYHEIVLNPDNSDCEYVYSDGTTYQFAWKRTNEQGAWVTDGVGQNGHWVKSTQTNGYCDDKALGQPKA